MKNGLTKPVLVLKTLHRQAGEATIDGKLVSWAEADQILVLPLESDTGKTLKYVLAPDSAEHILQLLDSVYWGCLVQLNFTGKYVSNIEIVNDWLADFYETQA